jgi:hypothetical protein
MDLYRAVVFLHVFLGVLLTGLALFWTIMSVALGRRSVPAQVVEQLRIVNTARWPHVAVPYALRIPLPWMTWLTILLLAATGAFAFRYSAGELQGLWWIKMALFAGVIVVQAFVQRRPSPLLIRANLALVLAVMVVSGWAIR